MRKKTLADIRNFCRPIQKEEFDLHKQEYENIRKLKLD